MHSDRYRADSGGRIVTGLSGYGFAIAPAAPPSSSQLSSAAQHQPGSFPVTARVKGGASFLVTSGQPLFLLNQFSQLEVSGAQPNDWYQVTTFEKGEGLGAGSPRSRFLSSAVGSGGVALDLSAAALPTDDTEPLFLNPPTAIEHSLWFNTNTAGVIVDLWFQMRGVGTWFHLQELELAQVPTGPMGAVPVYYAVTQRRLPGDAIYASKRSGVLVVMYADVLSEVG